MSSSALSLSKRWQYSALGILSFMAIWIFLATSPWFQGSAFLPTPLKVGERFLSLTVEPFVGYTLQQHILASLGRFMYAYLLAIAVGLPLGLLMAWSPWVERLFSPAFDLVRFVAPIAWVPFAALWFGTGIGGPILIIFMGAFPPILINTLRGAKYIDPLHLEAARMLGANGFRISTEVVLPAAFPAIVAGLRISAGLGWQSLVGSELIVASSGVGYLMVKGQSSIQTDIVMSAMVAIGIIGFIIDWVLRKLQSYVEHGYHSV